MPTPVPVALLCVIAVLPILAGCEERSPRYIPYVPAEGFRETLQIQLELAGTPVRVGEWITLQAQRESGPWEPIVVSPQKDDPPCERISPKIQEQDVASKVQWDVTPAGSAAFNVPGPPDFVRQIRFTRPGRFRIRAASEGCLGRFYSETIEVEVR